MRGALFLVALALLASAGGGGSGGGSTAGNTPKMGGTLRVAQ